MVNGIRIQRPGRFLLKKPLLLAPTLFSLKGSDLLLSSGKLLNAPGVLASGNQPVLLTASLVCDYCTDGNKKKPALPIENDIVTLMIHGSRNATTVADLPVAQPLFAQTKPVAFRDNQVI